MSEPHNPPKLFLHKPKKASHPPGGEVEQAVRVPVQQQPPTVAAVPVKPPFWYRYRAGVGALLLVNLGIGGYVLSRPKPVLDTQLHKGTVVPEPAKAKSNPEQAPAPVVAAAAAVAAPEWTPPPKVTVSEEEQRQLLQWVLQERRKVKAQNKAEKARIDQEKKLLKEFLRAKQLPLLV